MSVSIIPKSAFRKNRNITVGYGEVPAVNVNGVQGWGLPGGLVTFREAEAYSYAVKLDKEIRARMTDVKQLLKAG